MSQFIRDGEPIQTKVLACLEGKRESMLENWDFTWDYSGGLEMTPYHELKKEVTGNQLL